MNDVATRGTTDALDVPESDIVKWERAYELAILHGYSYRGVAKELDIDPRTAKAWVDKYRGMLATLRTTDKLEQTIELEQMVFQAIRQADDVYARAIAANKGLTAVGAINSKKALLDLILRIRGLEAPKQERNRVEGHLTISWGEPEIIVEAESRNVETY